MLTNTSIITILPTIILALFASTSSHTENQQRYTIYSEANCEGESETFTSSKRHLKHLNTSRLGYFGKVKSRRIYGGVWREFPDHNFGSGSAALKQPSIVDGNDGPICITTVLPTQMVRQEVISIRIAGNPDLTSVGLSLFTGSYFSGEELYFDGSRISLPIQQTFESWGFTGNGDWTFFEETDFMGPSQCLRSSAINKANQDSTNVGYPVIYNTKTFLQVGSLHRGCYKSLARFNGGVPILNVIDDSPMDQKPALTLYSFRYHLFNIGHEVRLPRARAYNSYSFSGTNPRNWTVYERLDDAENNRFPICVIHDGMNKTRPEDLIFKFELHLEIVAIKEGCVGDPVPENLQHLQNAAASTRICTTAILVMSLIMRLIL